MSDNKDYTRKRLLDEHLKGEQGTWKILGEDPNCDLGGHHYEPELETVIGTYSNVVEYALGLKGFFCWGAGGRIVRLAPPGGLVNVDTLTNPAVKKLEDERKQLQQRLKAIETELHNLIRK